MPKIMHSDKYELTFVKARHVNLNLKFTSILYSLLYFICFKLLVIVSEICHKFHICDNNNKKNFLIEM